MLGFTGFALEGSDCVEAVATGPGTDVTMSGYCCVFGWFLSYVASLATFSKVCELDMWASLGCSFGNMTVLGLEMQLPVDFLWARGEPGFSFHSIVLEQEKGHS